MNTSTYTQPGHPSLPATPPPDPFEAELAFVDRTPLDQLPPHYCAFCSTRVTVITAFFSDGYCAGCRDIFHGLKGPISVHGSITPEEVETALAVLPEAWASRAWHRWRRIQARMRPGHELLRFTSDLQSPRMVIASGALWRWEGLDMAGIVLRIEPLVTDPVEDWPGERARFATEAEVAACPEIGGQRRAGDRVLYFMNDSPEAVAESGREGLVLIRGGQVVARVIQPRDEAPLVCQRAAVNQIKR